MLLTPWSSLQEMLVHMLVHMHDQSVVQPDRGIPGPMRVFTATHYVCLHST